MNTHFKAPDGELVFRATVIDGTALSIAEFLKAKIPNPNQDIKLCVFCIEEFYKLLAISVHTSNEQEFKEHLEKITSQSRN